jgi:hypothetical protein
MNNRYYVQGPNGEREYVDNEDLLNMGVDVAAIDEEDGEWDE